jgi:CheY-like chemotaxis protein
MPDFHLVTSVPPAFEAPCYRCRQPVDFLKAAFCDCVTRERSLLCPSCGGCACEAPIRERNAFWVSGPPALWDRRREEQNGGAERLQALDPESVPRPLALIADDDPIVLAVAGRSLRAMGFTTLMTSDPQEALALAKTMLPDLLLTDALMPHMDGRQLCLTLKSNHRTRHIKVIVMSALYRGAVQRSEAFREFRVDEFLAKPVKPGVLRDAVDRLMPELARRRQHSDDVRVAS